MRARAIRQETSVSRRSSPPLPRRAVARSSRRRPSARRPPRAFPGVSIARLGTWIAEFLEDLAAQAYRPGTIATYRKQLTRHAGKLHAAATAAELLRQLRPLAPATRALILSIARAFAAWCHGTGRARRLAFADPVKVKLDEAAPRPLAPAVLRAVERAAFAVPRARRPADRRAHAVRRKLRLLYALERETGGRSSDFLPLRVVDCALAPAGEEGLWIRRGKGRRARFVPLLPGRALTYLRASCRAQPPEAWVFEGNLGGHWSYDAAHAAWSQLMGAIGVDAGLHQLRHSATTELGRAGVSVRARQLLGGWRSLDQLQRYDLLTSPEVRAELLLAQRRRRR